MTHERIRISGLADARAIRPGFPPEPASTKIFIIIEISRQTSLEPEKRQIAGKVGREPSEADGVRHGVAERENPASWTPPWTGPQAAPGRIERGGAATLGTFDHGLLEQHVDEWESGIVGG